MVAEACPRTKVSNVRRTLAVVITSALLLTACGSESGGLGDVSVSDSKSPTVKVEKGFTTDSTDTRVVAEGSGEELADGDVVKINYVAVNGRTGEQFDNSFKADSPMTVTLTEGSILPGFVKGLTGQKIGSRVLVSIPPKDGFGQAQESLGIEADDSMVFLFDLVSKVPAEASGEAQELPGDLPKIATEDGVPTGFEATDETADPPTETESFVAIEGEGEQIEEGAQITAHYVGQVYPDGEVFDNSWERGTPSPFKLEELYQCWQDSVPGKTLGSRIVVLCPPGTSGSQPPDGADEDDTLVFVIDLLDAS